MKLTRLFDPMTDRYAFDMGLCSVSNGFAQVDTKQDASYFGTWASPTKRKIVNYCEGDVTVTDCDNDDEFVDEMRKMAAWNDESGYGPIGIDPGFDEDLKATFHRIGLADLLH